MQNHDPEFEDPGYIDIEDIIHGNSEQDEDEDD